MDTTTVPIAHSSPTGAPTGRADPSLRFRPFGSSQADLNLDLDAGRQSTPHLVTEILAACLYQSPGDRSDRDALWRLPVGNRIESLLLIYQLDEPGEIRIELRCANPACRDLIEVGLTTEELLESSRAQAVDDFSVEVDGLVLNVRRPTGLDQLSWLTEPAEDEATALRATVAALLIPPAEVSELSEEAVVAVEESLDRHDRLGAFHVSLTCPYCDVLLPYELDLAALLIERFRHAQTRLVEQIHAIASGYGWTESEILTIPRERRARYLSLLEREALHR